MANALQDVVALVAGATRGAGRGIARALGEQGAIVYCTGRSTRDRASAADHAAASDPPSRAETRPETIEETAELVTASGGTGVAVVADHTDDAQVRALAERIEADQGRLDVVVNDIWGGDALTEWGKRVWELDLSQGRVLLERAIGTHVITARHTLPLLRRSERGLIVEVTDGESAAYRGTLFYDLAKLAAVRIAFALSEELRDESTTAVALTPGFLRSEAMLDHFGVTAARWRDAVEQDKHFAHSETPMFVGRAIAALAADDERARFGGRLLSSWALAREYGFVDEDGGRPDWGAHRDSEEFGETEAASHERFMAGFARS